MLHVTEPLREEGGDMIVIESVENLAAFLARSHQLHEPQAAHVMGRCGCADADLIGQVHHAPLAREQGCDEAHAIGVAERPEQFGQLGGDVFTQGGVQASARHGRVAPTHERLFIYLLIVTAHGHLVKREGSSGWVKPMPDVRLIIRVRQNRARFPID